MFALEFITPYVVGVALLFVILGVIGKRVSPAPPTDITEEDTDDVPGPSSEPDHSLSPTTPTSLKPTSAKSDRTRPSVRIAVNPEQNSAKSKLQRNLATRNKTAPHIHYPETSLGAPSNIRLSQSENVIPLPEKKSDISRSLRIISDLKKFFKVKKADAKEKENSDTSVQLESQEPSAECDDPQKYGTNRRKANAGFEQNTSKLMAPTGDRSSVVSMEDFSQSVNTLQSSIKKWKRTQISEQKLRMESIAVSREHQAIIDDITMRVQTEVPLSLQMQTREEALEIVTRMRETYKNILGQKNQLTKDAMKREKEIRCSLFGAEQN